MTTSPIRHDEEITELVYPAEASAANEINTFLTKALHLDGRLQLSHRFRHEQLSENLVVIGGPVHNELTAQLIDDLRPEWHFEDHDFLAPDGKRFRSEIESHSSSTVRDFGILVRAKSPYESERWVTLVMGCHTWGCMIAARSMIDENVSKTSRLISGAKQFVFVCSAPIVGGVVQSVQMEDLWTY